MTPVRAACGQGDPAFERRTIAAEPGRKAAFCIVFRLVSDARVRQAARWPSDGGRSPAPTVRRRPARTPALHGAGAPWGRRCVRQGASVLERRCPHRPAPQAGMLRGPPRPRSIGTRRRCRHKIRMRGRGCGAGRRGRRRSMGPALHTSGGDCSGAPVSSPASAAGGHAPWASPPTLHRYAAPLSTRDSNEGPTVQRRPARTPALHGAGATYVRARVFWSAGVLIGLRRRRACSVGLPAHGPSVRGAAVDTRLE